MLHVADVQSSLSRYNHADPISLLFQGYRQDYIDLFNESNPSGEIVDSDWNHRIVAIAIGLGIGVSVKRFWLGLTLGRATYSTSSGIIDRGIFCTG
jgi:hypothetical protein